MNDLTIITPADPPLTMTSLEIAELLGVRHDDVRRNIKRLADRGIFVCSPMVDIKNHQNRDMKVYLLDKRASMIVVAQLSADFTAALLDRWDEPSRSSDKPDRKPAQPILAALEQDPATPDHLRRARIATRAALQERGTALEECLVGLSDLKAEVDRMAGYHMENAQWPLSDDLSGWEDDEADQGEPALTSPLPA